MKMSFRRSHGKSVLTALLCLLFAGFLAGCASKNPLMEAPAANTDTETAKPVETPAGTQQVEAKAAQGVVTTAEPTGVRKFLGIFSPYRIDVPQGNFVSREMVAQLQEGMQQPDGVSREQVRFVLGTPLLTDIFHADRWDYIFRLKKGSGEIISSRVTVFFQGNRLSRIEGDQLPTEQEYLALIAGAAPGASAPAAGK